MASADKGRLRAWLEELERIERPSASEGERRAAEWLVERVRRARRRGADRGRAGARHLLVAARDRRRAGRARRDPRPARPPPARRRARRRRGGGDGDRLPARQAADPPPAAPPHHLQRRLRARPGRRRAHDRPDRPPRRRPFRPRLPSRAPPYRRPAGVDRARRHQPAADGAGDGRPAARGARRADRQAPALAARRAASGLGSAAAMAEIGARDVVPGANDNGTAVVALLALAERLLAEPPQSTRVVLLSVGSEESFSEGIKAFGERHFDSAAAREQLLPLPGDARLAAPARAARRGLPERCASTRRAPSP